MAGLIKALFTDNADVGLAIHVSRTYHKDIVNN